MEISITKRDGTKEIFNADRINKSIERACIGLPDPINKVIQIATETQLTLYDGITEEEMDHATINAALQNAQEDPAYDKIATRLLLKTIYKKALGDYHSPEELEKFHRDNFADYIARGVKAGMLDERIGTKYDIEKLAAVLKPERDELYKYSGLSTMYDRYFIKDKEQQPIEVPQYFWMRVAMGMSYNEKDPTATAIQFYDKMSQLEYLSAGSTNIAAGTPHPKLSNCFLMEMHDDIEHIGKTVSDVLMLSKATGGIGLSVTKLRAKGSLIKSNNTYSTGPISFMKIIDTAIRAISRGGKKKGALCFYMENWHLDFADFLDLKQNAGDDYLRARTANTAVYMSDEFMRRVESGADWYLFDPSEVKDLNELYGDAFSKRYNEYIEMAEKGQIRLWKKIKAAEQFRNILVLLQTTSHPWLTWKDTINVRALNNNTGTIHSSNLCTEVTLPQDRDNVAVCNLVSINLARHIKDGDIDWKELETSVRLATRQLDNLVDINELPIVEARRADSENRAVGLGLMGFADAIEQLGHAYDSIEACELSDRVFEFISYMSIDESANMAQERGSYKNFPGSGWSKGMVPVDTLAVLEKSRGEKLTVFEGSLNPKLNWNTLREKVKKGMRNATVLAIAPNANIGLVAGTSPGIDPRFAQMFSRNKFSGKYLEINHNLIYALKDLGLWERVKDQLLKEYGDISMIDDIPQEIKDVYKTSFQVSPYAFVEVAARAQKWVDQAISRNMYLETRDIDETMKIYLSGWSKGLKTTYYLHMKPRHNAEQSTVRVNKAEKHGQKGFSSVSAFTAPKVSPIIVDIASPVLNDAPETETVIASNSRNEKITVHLPEDPQDQLLCEGCQ